MKFTELFTKTSKTTGADADSVNARLLTQAGCIHKEMAGVYSFLPLGLRVLNKIENIVRQEINSVGGQEIMMSAFSPKAAWQTTNRWDNFDALFKVPSSERGKEYGLNPTHEELVTPIVKQYVQSYKDLPVAVYQIQTKFRSEPRAKSGLLRGREFRMKDLYSFHSSQEDFIEYYHIVAQAYHKIFNRLGIGDRTYYTYASGGAFTKEFSHEFQTANKWGEDTVYLCECGTGYNKEIYKKGMNCRECGKKEMRELTATEVGNIFPLGSRFSDAFDFTFTNERGERQKIIMGCYGIGTSRLMGTMAEVLSDEHGLVWPTAVAPFMVNVISLGKEIEVVSAAKKLYKELVKADVEVLWDDRDVSAGTKFKDNDLLGIPVRLVVSEKLIKERCVEWKERTSTELTKIPLQNIEKKIYTFFKNNH